MGHVNNGQVYIKAKTSSITPHLQDNVIAECLSPFSRLDELVEPRPSPGMLRQAVDERKNVVAFDLTVS